MKCLISNQFEQCLTIIYSAFYEARQNGFVVWYLNATISGILCVWLCVCVSLYAYISQTVASVSGSEMQWAFVSSEVPIRWPLLGPQRLWNQFLTQPPWALVGNYHWVTRFSVLVIPQLSRTLMDFGEGHSCGGSLSTDLWLHSPGHVASVKAASGCWLGGRDIVWVLSRGWLRLKRFRNFGI